MRNVSVAVIVLASSMIVTEVRGGESGFIPFHQIWLMEVPLPGGQYVFRDSTDWADEFVPYWPAAWTDIDGVYQRVPPPRPDFSDSLIVALSYGMTACEESGGEIESIRIEEGKLTVHLTHVYGNMPMCAASAPRVDFYRIAHDDIPAGAEFVFIPAALPYDVEARRWYPLEVGNAWHYWTVRDLQRIDMVEIIDSMVEIAGRSWYHVEQKHCSADPCPFLPSRFLSWTDDDFLLTSTNPADYVDTLHAELETSPFRVNLPYQSIARADGDSSRILVVKYFGTGIRHLTSMDGGVHYLYEIGPSDFLRSAIIDGEHYEDTAFIMSVLSTEHPAAVITSSRIDVFPHPATTGSTLAFTPQHSGEISLVLYDLLGRELMSARAAVIAGSEWRTRLGADLAPGAYFARIVSEHGILAQRTVVVGR